ncbi:hypothetical protein [Xanthomonas sp. BRIP62411]|uniref:hypothetical protein n=1 Tax=Xanthomonas sp. BRIP62411 TaxID=2182389 RepID=UPI000F8E0CE7|nr:hypothetical protein [Xanthomonas sp. BRIP62411]
MLSVWGALKFLDGKICSNGGSCMDCNLLLHILAGSHDIYALDMGTKVSKAFWGYSLLGYVLVQNLHQLAVAKRCSKAAWA